MENRRLLTVTLSLLSLGLLVLPSSAAIVHAAGFKTEGHVRAVPSDKTDPLDPENPLTPVDPGGGPSTEGDLRIDFVSAVNFADADIMQATREYPSLAQLFHGATTARAHFIQVTDLREGIPGWELQLKQTTQFKSQENIDLLGATLSFDKGWANSGGIGKSPTVFRDTITIVEIGSSYQVATAAKGKGNGTWMISFGASASNHNGQENTLSPLETTAGEAVIDTDFGKPAFVNAGVKLIVPTKTVISPGNYQTELQWILQATP